MDEVPVGFCNVEGIDPGEAGGVVDEAVEAAEVAVHGGEQSFDFGHPFEVGGKDGGPAALPGGFHGLGGRGVIVQRDASTFPGQSQGDRAADALGGAGDQDDFAVEVGQRVLLTLWYVEYGGKKYIQRKRWGI